MGRREFPDAVPEHHVRADPDFRPERRQRARQRVERRLGERGLVEASGSGRLAEHHVKQRRSPLLTEHRFAAIQHRPRRRLGLVELPPHPEPLAPLARVQERHLRGRLRRSGALRRGERPQLLLQVGTVPEGERRPEIEVGPASARHPGHVRERLPREAPTPFFDPQEIPAGEFRERLRAPRGKRKQPHLPAAAAMRQLRARRGTSATTSGPRGEGAGPSRTRWAFVPERLNELIAARRGRSGTSGHGVGSAVTRSGSRSQSTRGVGLSKWRCRGITPARIESRTLMTPATPAAASRCPTFVFTDPISSGRSVVRALAYTAAAARSSIGSPSSVPVPCASR